MTSSDEGSGGGDITRAERWRRVVRHRLEGLMQSDPQLYYRPTTEVARTIHKDIGADTALDAEDREAVRVSPCATSS